jgi:Flp pilus assembly protein TadG
MVQILKGLARHGRAFLRQEGGSITVEFSLWVPLLLAVLFLGINASLLFSAQSNFWNISRDTARVVSRHAMSAEEAEAYARDRARSGSYEPDVQVQIDDQLGIVTVTISAEMRALVPFDVANFALGQIMSVQVSQSLEPI